MRIVQDARYIEKTGCILRRRNAAIGTDQRHMLCHRRVKTGVTADLSQYHQVEYGNGDLCHGPRAKMRRCRHRQNQKVMSPQSTL
jgi:hypothetical protein